MSTRFISLILAGVMFWQCGAAELYGYTLGTQGPVAPTSTPSGNGFDSLLAEVRDLIKAAPEKGSIDLVRLAYLKKQLSEENDKIEAYFRQLDEVSRQKKL